MNYNSLTDIFILISLLMTLYTDSVIEILILGLLIKIKSTVVKIYVA